MSSSKVNVKNRDRQIKSFHRKFKLIRNRWIPTARRHDTGIGKTFEDIMGIKENNSPLADFGHWELKTKRMSSKTMLTLFTCSPTFPENANNNIRLVYGYPDLCFPKVKCFRGTIQVGRSSKIRKKIVRLSLNKNDLFVKSGPKHVAGWKLSVLKQKTIKIHNIILVLAKSDKKRSQEKFQYLGYTLYAFKGFSAFVNALRNGYIEVDIRLGAYKSGKNKGKPHDHGTAFRIHAAHLDQIFDIYSG